MAEMNLGTGVASAREFGGMTDARQGDRCTRSGGQARGKGAVHAGRRIRSRRNPSCPRRKAWRALRETGDCDWALEGATSRCQAAPAAGKRARRDQAQCRGRKSACGQASQDIDASCARDSRSAQTRGPQRRIAEGAVTSGHHGGPTSAGGCASRGSTSRGPDEGPGGTASRGTESRSNATTSSGSVGSRMAL